MIEVFPLETVLMVMADVNALKNTVVPDVISVMKDSMIFRTANVSV